MDVVHTERDRYRADICVLLSDPCGWCGLATGLNVSASEAFCVVDWDCLMGYYSFGHEIGHLHGCGHDTYVYPTNPHFSYGHALVNVSGGWRTIMGYNTECDDQTQSSQIVNFGWELVCPRSDEEVPYTCILSKHHGSTSVQRESHNK